MEAVSSGHRSSIVYVLTAATAVVIYLLLPELVSIVSAFAIAILGVPHGSLDLHLLSTRAQRVRELVIYLGSIALVLAVWYLAPSIMLALFLVNSAWHFGDCDIRMQGKLRLPVVMAYGVSVLVLFIQPADPSVAWIIAELVGTADRVVSLPLTQLDAWWWTRAIAIAAVVVLPLGKTTTRGATLLRSAVMVAMSLLLPSLLAFTWYFVVLHSWTSMDRLRHVLDTQRPWTWRRMIMASAPLSLITFAGIAVAGLMFSTAGVLTVLFVALSALTVPHSRLFRRVYNS